MQAEFQFFEKLLLRILKSETVAEHSVCKSVIRNYPDFLLPGNNAGDKNCLHLR